MSDYKNISTAVLLINTGSPDSPGIIPVAKYLSRFLGNRRIIALPWFIRKILVNIIIIPFRSWKSSKRYQRLWNLFEKKFPLLHYGIASRQLLQSALGEKATIFLGMCYGQPTIKASIEQIIDQRFSKLVIIPLFPHYASSSSGVALEMVTNTLKKYNSIPEIKTVHAFYDHPLFIEAFAERIRSYHPENYDHILFTYHSLPISHIRKTCSSRHFDNNNEFVGCENKSCYINACYRTTKLICEKLNWPNNRTETVFQSQLSGNWVKPFANESIIKKAKNGTKSLLVVAPSFVADCLETTLELGEEYRQLFLTNGGEKYDLVKSLNDSPIWIKMLQCIFENIDETPNEVFNF